MKKKLKIVLLIIIILLLVTLVPTFIITNLLKKFQINEFNTNVTLTYNSELNEKIDVCYGNKFKCNKVKITKETDLDTTKIGEYKVKYTFTYKDKTMNLNQKVKVIDDIPPEITFSTDTFNVCPSTKDANFKVTAYDEYDKDLTNFVEQKIENDKVIFTVKDKSNNKTEVIKDLTFIDKEKPKITLKGSSTIYLKINTNYTEYGATVTDNCDKDLTNKLEISSSVNTKVPGEYNVTYKVKDNSNNESVAVRKVFVYGENASTNKTIYLTFDDGPGPYTEKLLDILKKYNVKATFFVTNQSITKPYDNIILREYNEGHTIGLHTDSHNYNIYQSVNTYFNDLYKIQDKVKRITGYTSNLIRFPGGSSNTVSKSYDNGTKIMTTLTKEVEKRGFKYFDWNVSSGDAGGATTKEAVFKNVTNSLSGNGSYIVLQHDIKSFSVNAVEDIIKYGLSKGYNFKPLTESSPNMHHKVNN